MSGTAARAALLLVLGSGSLLAQQPAVLTGRVLNGATRVGIASAEVMVGDERRTTDDEGRFRTGPVQAGKHLLEVRAIGYSAYSRELVVLPGQSVSLAIELTPVVHQLDSVTVVAGREPSIGRDELAVRGGDLATALNGWQGIVISRTGHGNEAIAQIRGSAADEVLVLVDGFALNDPFTGRADLSRVAVEDIETISLLRGVQSARAGSRAMAGVIQINTRQVTQPEIMAGIGSDHARRVRVAGDIDRAALALNLEILPHDYSVDLPNGGGEGRRLNAGGEIWSLNGKARLGLDWTVRGSLSDRGLPGTSVNPTPSARGRDRSLLIGGRTGGSTWLSTSLQWLDTRAEDTTPPPGFIEYDNHTWGWGGTAELGVRGLLELAGWRGQYSASADARHDRFAGDAVRKHATFSRAGSAFSASLSRVGTLGVWTLAPSIRVDWYTGQTLPLASARLDATLQHGQTSLSGAIGNGVTVPALADLLFRDGVGVAINPDLRPERVTWEGELGIGQGFSLSGVSGSLRVSGFYGQIDDMILWTPKLRYWSPDNFAVRRRGGEATLDILSELFAISGSVAYNRVTYDIPDGSPVPYRPGFSSSAQASWTPGPWRLSLGWNHLGTRFSRNREMNPLPPFDLFHFSAGRRLGRFSLAGEIRDLTDVRPVYIAGFPTPGRTFHLSLTMELP
jgi:outer membrane cobalamin receptor